MSRYPGSGADRPCEHCGEPMLPSLSGHGYCLRCAKPIGEIPLVDLRTTPKAFMEIRTKWGRALNKHEPDAYHHYFREDPYVTFPPKARGGGPRRKLTLAELKELRQLVKRRPGDRFAAYTRAINAARAKAKGTTVDKLAPKDKVHRHRIVDALEELAKHDPELLKLLRSRPPSPTALHAARRAARRS